MRDLLEPAFMIELEALRRQLDVRARSAIGGVRVSLRRGSSAEFEDYRPYSPGDDARRIDWAAYARTDETVVKLFRAEESAILRILIDASVSMRFGAPAKIDVAKRLAAALGYMALAGLESAQVIVASDDQTRAFPTCRGRAGLAAWLRALMSIRAHGSVDLGKAIDAVLARSDRPGVLVVVSDFFNANEALASSGRARARGHDIALVHLLAAEELSPTVEGDCILVDAESDATVALTIDADAIEAYHRELAALCLRLRQFARTRRASYVRACSDEPLAGVVRRIVAQAIDSLYALRSAGLVMKR